MILQSSNSMGGLKRQEAMLLLAFFSLLYLPLFHILRFLDDNTLTSWRWVFDAAEVERLLLWLPPLILLAWVTALRLPLEKKPLLSLALLSSVAVLPLWQEPELLLDSARYFLQAKHLAAEGPTAFLRNWGETIPAWTDMPLIPFCYGLLFRIFGETRITLQLFNTCVFFLTGLATLLLGREIRDEEVGAYGALLLLGIPYLPTQVPLLLVDIHTMFLLTLALLAFVKALRQGGLLWLTLSSLITLAAILAKYSSLPLLAILFPSLVLICGPGQWRITLSRAIAVAVSVFGLAGALALWKWPVVSHQLELLVEYQWPALGRWQESLTSTFLFQIHPFLTVLAALGTYRAVRMRDRLFLLPAAFFLALIMLDVKRLRYLLPLLPLFTIMAAHGLAAIRDQVVKRFLCCAILFTSFLLLLGAYLPFFLSTSMMNLKNAGLLLDSLPSERVAIELGPQELSTGNTALAVLHLDLFTQKQLTVRHWPKAAKPEAQRFSPLRFSWRIGSPPFYPAPEPNDTLPLVVITGTSFPEPGCGSQPAQFPAPAHFRQSAGVFRFKTLVSVCP